MGQSVFQTYYTIRFKYQVFQHSLSPSYKTYKETGKNILPFKAKQNQKQNTGQKGQMADTTDRIEMLKKLKEDMETVRTMYEQNGDIKKEKI